MQPAHFAASAGGHLDLLMTVAGQTLGCDGVTWVTSETERGEALRRQGLAVELLPEHHRSPPALARNALAALRLVRRTRPRVVVTSGAGVVAPYCLFARLFGARLVYIETMARVTSPSATARLLSRFASRVIVQWEELREALPDAAVCRPTLLEGLGEHDGVAGGSGTFVAVGTHDQPFVRLLEMVEDAARRGLLPAPVRAQTGASTLKPAGIEARAWWGREELSAALRGAQLVVCHAGAGIIAAALAAGRRPLVLPRRADLGEHIDEHQQQLARKLADWGLVVLLEDRIEKRDVARAQRPLELPAEVEAAPSAAQLVASELGLSPV